VVLGDRDGLTDLSAGIEILTEHGSRYLAWAYIDLSIALDGLGDVRAAGRAIDDAFAHAQRFGEVQVIRDAEPRRATFAYLAGDWVTAREIADRYIANPALGASVYQGWYRWPHAQIALAVGDYAAVEEDSGIIADIYLPAAHGLRAVMAQAQGRAADASAAADAAVAAALSGRWLTTDGLVPDLLPIKTHHHRLVEVASRLPVDNPWRQVVETVADSRYADAVPMFEQIGCEPLAAQARVFATEAAWDRGDKTEAIEHADLALAFYERVDATLYAQKAAELRRSLDT